jgi:hypothetical protein
MKNLIRLCAILTVLAGLCAISLSGPQPPCNNGYGMKACFVHYCTAGAEHCSALLWNYTTTTTCNVWCCPNGSGGYSYGYSQCGTPVPDGCCRDLGTEPDNPPTCS